MAGAAGVPAAALWYKDAVIYQLHVKAFFDANDDGMGDFGGLTQRLDYIRNLGVNAVWLLPFYPSPLRDDGYDIADYKSVNPAYGTMHDFRAFVRAAHERGIRVITELVINHTSDQHPWFQRARRAKRGSAYRDFYVWSDTDEKYAGTRIIFTDTETSNWTWDPVAGQYYWHRFFAHQPDLNFANPRVVAAVVDVMRFWFAAGVDGMRLDAVPYLCEREGTTCENLPETHGVLKVLRAVLDAEFPDKVFLAEANQWPEDVRAYFGDGDECHMAFHFPLMPRMFMAIAEEDRYPIVDIMQQTPEIPATCQWAIFLRNHDEMTLEMVTERERDVMYSTYAPDPRARINLGIRRRLAPLMENDRRRIELLTALLLSMPGTPILYYGDEIGMGDNVFLGDRNGVRTPMQWSVDRNGGFSRCDPAQLFLPPIMDPLYGYSRVNVEAESRNPSSLLNWLRTMIGVRQGYAAFGRGSLSFLTPANRRVLAYVREHGDETILCVANLARSAQPVALDLARWKGRVPVEMVGWSPFPTIGDERYVLTLPGHAFFWFLIADAAPPAWERRTSEPLAELRTLVFFDDGTSNVNGQARAVLESDVLPAFLSAQRWFAVSDAHGITLIDVPRIEGPQGSGAVAIVAVSSGDADAAMEYNVPLAPIALGRESPSTPVMRAAVARTRSGHREGLLIDGVASDAFLRTLVDVIRADATFLSQHGEIVCQGTPRMRSMMWPGTPDVRPIEAEQENSSVVIGEATVCKVYRRLVLGPHPEIETARFLERVGFTHVPSLLGSAKYVPHGSEPRALCLLTEYIEGQGDGWNATLGYLARTLNDQAAASNGAERDGDIHAAFLDRVRVLGARIAELHRAFATHTGDSAFDPEPAGAADIAVWRQSTSDLASDAFNALGTSLDRLPLDIRDDAAALVSRRDDVMTRIETLDAEIRHTVKTRRHGDLHLGNVLISGGEPFFVGFGGRSDEPSALRREKSSPLRDIARMVRSFNYAAVAAIRGLAMDRSDDVSRLAPLARDWERRSAAALLQGYNERIAGCACVPANGTHRDALLRLFLMENAFTEVLYELTRRPSWVRIPLEGLARILGDERDVVGASRRAR